MSHQETIARMNAELNTTEAWERRWQIERQHNEHLASQGSMVRTGVHDLHRRAVERFTNHQAWAAEARTALDARKADTHERMCSVQTGRVSALSDVLELLDRVGTE
jgi:hypothetical protein